MAKISMFRITTAYFISLTFSCESPVISEARKLVKRLANSLRDKGHWEGWEYSLELSFSHKDPRNGNLTRLHIHIIIIANPGCTIAKWVKAYWEHRNGHVQLRKIHTAAELERVRKYTSKQSFGRTWRQKLGDPGVPGCKSSFSFSPVQAHISRLNNMQPFLIPKQSANLSHFLLAISVRHVPQILA